MKILVKLIANKFKMKMVGYLQVPGSTVLSSASISLGPILKSFSSIFLHFKGFLGRLIEHVDYVAFLFRNEELELLPRQTPKVSKTSARQRNQD